MLWDCPKYEARALPQDGIRAVLRRIGPVVRSVVDRAAQCAETKCNGHGRCSELPTAAGMVAAAVGNATVGGVTCNCTAGWEGQRCNRSTYLALELGNL